MASFLYDEYRNRVAGKTATHAAAILPLTDTLQAAFNDDTEDAPLVTHTFASTYLGGMDPVFASAETLLNITVGSVGVGVVNCDDMVFDGSQLLIQADQVESLLIFKFIAGANGSASPMLARYDTPTGLPLTPNGAAVTVIVNAGGLWLY